MRTLTLILLLCVASVASAQTFVGPNGNSGAAGTRGDPIDIATAATRSVANGGTFIFLDSVYSVSATGYTFGKIGSANLIMADTVGGRKRPIIFKTGSAVTLSGNAGTAFVGIWLNGTFALNNGCKTKWCAAFNVSDDGIEGGYVKDTIQNCLIANAGQRPFWHGIYFSAAPTGWDSSFVVYRNVIVAGDSAKNNSAYAIQLWHGVRHAYVQKNFTGSTSYMLSIGESDGEPHANDAVVRDNVFWSNVVQPSFNFDNTDTISFIHNLIGKWVKYWPGFGAAIATVDSLRYVYPEAPGIDFGGNPYGTHVVEFPYSSVATYVGTDSATVDSAVARLAASFYSKTAAQIYADTTILPNWQRLLNTVDFFQGTVEEAVSGSIPPSYPHRWYVDNVGGSNSNSGHNIDSALATIAYLNSNITNAGGLAASGDTVLFNRGDVWREQLNNYKSNITFTNYGTGAKPYINASTLLASGWVNRGSNVWRHAFTPTSTGSAGRDAFIDQVFFNNARGTEVSSKAFVTSANRWYDDTTGVDSLYIYSTSDPATAFTSPGVEATDRYCILPSLGNPTINVTIDGIDWGKANGLGLATGGPPDTTLIIKNCLVKNNGGTGIYSTVVDTRLQYDTLVGNGTTRLDHGCYLHGESLRSFIEYCVASDNTGAGFDYESSGNCRYNISDSNGVRWDTVKTALGHSGFGIVGYPPSGDTLNFYYNIIRDNYSHGIWLANAGTAIIYNNIIARTGGAGGSDENGLHMQMSGVAIAKNNIFYNQGTGYTDVHLYSGSLTLDYNYYWGNPGTSISWGGINYTTAQFATFQGAQGQEAHGKVADPQFANAAANDFRLSALSPCIGLGINNGLSQDFFGDPVPGITSGLYDVGIYQSAGSGGGITGSDRRSILHR